MATISFNEWGNIGISLQHMIQTVESYILIRKGVEVNIQIELFTSNGKYNDHQPNLNKLGRAYDIANEWMQRHGYA